MIFSILMHAFHVELIKVTPYRISHADYTLSRICQINFSLHDQELWVISQLLRLFSVILTCVGPFE